MLHDTTRSPFHSLYQCCLLPSRHFCDGESGNEVVPLPASGAMTFLLAMTPDMGKLIGSNLG
jgi:hypothetical protein